MLRLPDSSKSDSAEKEALLSLPGTAAMWELEKLAELGPFRLWE